MALTISPPLVEIETEAGESFIQKIFLYNETNQLLSVYPDLQNFIPDKETGLPQYLGNNDPLAAASWIKLPVTKVDLQPNEKKDLLLNIKVSKLAEPGGHYVALFWGEQPLENNGVATANRLAIIFLFKISGQIKEELKIVSLEENKNSKGEDVFNLVLENIGNIHLRPKGEIKIFDREHKEKGIVEINTLNQTILPQSQRSFEINWPEAQKFWGTHYAQAQVVYGGKKQELTSPEIKFFLRSKNHWGTIIGLAVAGFLLGAIAFMAKKRKQQIV